MYKQGGGGAIGLHLTGAVARVCMDLWGEGMRILMEENLVRVYLFEKYVDDINWLLEALGLGVRWDRVRKCLVWSEQWEEEDIKGGNTQSRVTMTAMVEMANTVCDYITFTGDFPDDHQGVKSPCWTCKYGWRRGRMASTGCCIPFMRSL